MKISSLLGTIGVFAGLMVATDASAATGYTTGAVNMRTCASVRCARILTIPHGARIWIYYCNRWCRIRYAGRRGFVSGRYVTYGGYRRPPVVIYPPYYDPPYYDDRPRFRPPPRRRPPPIFESPPTNWKPRVPPPPDWRPPPGNEPPFTGWPPNTGRPGAITGR